MLAGVEALKCGLVLGLLGSCCRAPACACACASSVRCMSRCRPGAFCTRGEEKGEGGRSEVRGGEGGGGARPQAGEVV